MGFGDGSADWSPGPGVHSGPGRPVFLQSAEGAWVRVAASHPRRHCRVFGPPGDAIGTGLV